MRRAYLMFGLSPAATGFVRARWFVGMPGSSPERKRWRPGETSFDLVRRCCQEA
jgi:hypothetical protein